MRAPAALLALLALLPAGLRAQPVPVERVLAAVGDRVIMASEVMGLIAGNEQAVREKYKGEELEARIKELYERGLSAAVDRALVLREFENSKGQLPELAVDERLNEIVEKRFKGDRIALQNALSAERKTIDDLRTEIREEIIFTLLRQQEVSAKVVVSPAQVLAAYEANRDRYASGEKLRLRLISLSKADLPADLVEKKVKLVQDAIAAGKDFEQLARDYSDFAADKGGDLGELTRADLRADFRAAVATLAAGQTAGPITGEKDVSFLQVVSITPARATPIEEVQAELEREIRRKAEETLYDGWVKRLRQKYPVVLYPAR